MSVSIDVKALRAIFSICGKKGMTPNALQGNCYRNLEISTKNPYVNVAAMTPLAARSILIL
jgi:hypothetical protein